MYCIYLKKKKGNPYCKLLKKEILLSCCQECGNKEYKTKKVKNSFYKNKNAQYNVKTVQKRVKKQQIIQRRSKKAAKADRNRFSIITNDLENCIICGAKKDNLHEVFYGSYRHLSIKYGLVIPLCLKHHTMGLYSIHHNRQLDLYYKKLSQSIFIKRYSYDLFIKEFKIDYIEKYKEEN